MFAHGHPYSLTPGNGKTNICIFQVSNILRANGGKPEPEPISVFCVVSEKVSFYILDIPSPGKRQVSSFDFV